MRRSRILWAILPLLAAPAARAVPTRPAEGPASRSAARPPAAPTTRPQTRPSAADLARQRIEKARKIAGINQRLLRLFAAEKYDRCQPLLGQILEIDPNNSVAWYNLACVHSRLGREGKAIECLNTAVEHGYSAFRHLERDPDLDALRELPGYKELLARKDEIHRQRAAKIRDQLRERFGADYLYEIDHERKLVFATNVDRTTLEEMKHRLTAYASAQWEDLFTHPFEGYLTIVIPKSSDWRWGPAVGGFYTRAGHILFARTVGLTLVHEFTHALHAADQEGLGQQHPIWITEGLATLFESSKVADGHAVPQPNRRLNLLQVLLQRKRTIPLAEFVRYDRGKFMGAASTAYAEGRYVMMYLHDKGLLRKWYDAYTAGFDDDPTGGKAMEKVLGKKLGEIEKDWRQWAASLDAPALRLPARHAYLGVQLRQDIDGVRIGHIEPGSGADKSDLRAGDVILALDGERTLDAGQLMEIVLGHEVDDEVAVRYRRDGKYATTTVRLGAMPQRLSAQGPGTRPAPAPRPGHTPKPQVQPTPKPGHDPEPKPKPKAIPKPPATQPATRKAA